MNWSKFVAAIAFYTCLPVPTTFALDFQGIARFAPLVGIVIGMFLGLLDWGLHGATVPLLTRSALLVICWIGITGGLHLDGAMDTADGLAVPNPDRRLEVMADSATGAFGAMAAIAIVLLKVTALASLALPDITLTNLPVPDSILPGFIPTDLDKTDLDSLRWLTLIVACGWGRWAQQVAILQYPYLKPTGKGAFHKEAIQSIWDILPSLLLLLSLSSMPLLLVPGSWLLSCCMGLGGCAIALLVPAYFNRKLGGHTGDTYGAVVEWTEALFLVLMTVN
ncbi:MAG TPA: adenosylcobinamide-GDP ribazoletransferase [Allocoleopsis sp.]